jgi:hypothetical protein
MSIVTVFCTFVLQKGKIDAVPDNEALMMQARMLHHFPAAEEQTYQLVYAPHSKT